MILLSLLKVWSLQLTLIGLVIVFKSRELLFLSVGALPKE